MQRVIIDGMRSVYIHTHNKKEFDKAFSLLIEFDKERKMITLKDDEDIGFVFLLKFKEDSALLQEKILSKKSH
jgi:hypothetical protein